MSLGPTVPAVVNQQQQVISGLNLGTSSGVPSTVQNNNNILRAPLQELQDQLGHSSQLQTSVVTQDAFLNYLQNLDNSSGKLMASTPQLLSMLPPPLPSQSLNKTSSSPDLSTSESASQSLTPSASAPQPTQPSYMSSQTYTAPSSSQSSVRHDNVDAEKATSSASEQETAMYPLIAALKESTSLYDLPLDVLERAVGDIIREDGFIPLVSCISSMNRATFSCIKIG